MTATTASVTLRATPQYFFAQVTADLVSIRPTLVHEARAIVKRVDVAEEVVQDVFMRLWEGRITFDRERGSLRNWLLVVTRRAAIDAARREGRQYRNEVLASGLVNAVSAPEDTIEQMDRRADVEVRLNALSDEQRQAVELAYFADLSQALVADWLDAPLGTVKSRIRRAMLTMAEV